jgi:hypothetical protein
MSATGEAPSSELFSVKESEFLKHEDSSAWWSVCAVLVGVAGGGVVLMAVTVLWIATR